MKMDEILSTIPTSVVKEIDGTTDVGLYVRLVESIIFDQPLVEDIVDHEVKQLDLLHNSLSSKPVIGDKYIPILVMYTNPGLIRLMGHTRLLKLIDIKPSGSLTDYVFENGKRYPDSRLTEKAYTKLFLFDSNTNFSKFLTVANLTFKVQQFTESQIRSIKRQLKEMKL